MYGRIPSIEPRLMNPARCIELALKLKQKIPLEYSKQGGYGCYGCCLRDGHGSLAIHFMGSVFF